MTLADFMTFLLQAPTRAEKGRLLWETWWLWVGLLLVGLILIGVVGAAAAARRRAAKLTGGGQRRKRAIKDAWAEAGRRAAPIAEEPGEDDRDAETGR